MKHLNDSENISDGAVWAMLIKQAAKAVLVLSFIAFSGSLVAAAPPLPHRGVIVIPPPPRPYKIGLYPPPAGKVWVEISGTWVLVMAPPENGPYIWVNGRWMPDTSPIPENAEWIPGHWTAGGWIPGHWRAFYADPVPGVVWIYGHWEGNRWIEGHWQGSPPHGRKWIPGHYGPSGRWIPGHWR